MRTTYYPRPEILARPELKQGHAVIEASAGTGKTYTLEHLVLDLIINSKAKIEEILVVTFTDAATRELRERVRAMIRKVCDEGFADKPQEGPCWEINEATRSLLREALFRFDGAAISTIHGFCQRILSEQAFLGGRLFEQEHASGADLFGLAFREEVRVALAESGPVGTALRRWLEQGSRLKDLEAFLYRCHREGCPERCPVTPLWDPQGFLKAAEALPQSEALIEAAEAFFTDNHTRRGYVNLIQKLNDTLTAMESAAWPETAALFFQWANKECTINKVKLAHLEHVNRAAAEAGAPGAFKDLAAGLREMVLRAASEGSFFVFALLPRVQARLASRKRSLGLIDYDDMLLGVREALEGPGAGTLLEALRRRWKYALVDEFQDTDPVQWEIFRRIFVDGGSGHRLFVIGDPKQAIYGFRGADVHTYEVAKQYLMHRYGASRLPLKQNFRSTGALIDAVNAILTAKDSAGRGFFDGLNRYDDPVSCGDTSRLAVEGGRPAAPVHLVHLYGGERGLSAGSIRLGVACFIAEEIRRLTDPQRGLATGKGGEEPQPVKLSDIYILTRTGQEGRQIGEVLRRYGIAHAFYKQEGLFQTDEASDIQRLLEAIAAPADPAARMLAWLTPFFGVPLEDLTAWQEAGESHPLVARLLKWKRLADAQQWARLFDDILTSSGLVRRLIFAEGERALTNYLHLFEVLLAEAHARPVTLRDLARSLKARIDGRKLPEGREGDLQRLETDKEAVQILTMHKAKGLEAEVVFIGGGFGSLRGSGPQMEIYHRGSQRCLHIGKAAGEIKEAIEQERRQEDQRLAYVALTRAKSRLYLPYFGPAIGEAPEGRVYGYSRLGSFYGALQRQLDLLRQQGYFARQDLFVLREASCLVRPPRWQGGGERLEDWPDGRLLEPTPSRAEEAAQLKAGHRGVLLTSYTRMKRGQDWQPPAADADGQEALRSEEIEGEALTGSPPAPGAEVGETAPAGLPELPGGPAAGTFLHALLEDADPAEIAGRSFTEWSALPSVQRRAAALARRHGFAAEYLPEALQIVYRAYRTPLAALSREENATLAMPGGIASEARQRAEMSFVYPIPEKSHPLISSGAAVPRSGNTVWPYRAVRGYLQGMIDLVFEHEGRVYVLDWKSDRLPAYDRESLNAHMEANYQLQARIYVLAVLRLLDIRSQEEYASRFGGVLYLFIRGLCPGKEGGADEGIWFSRPPWAEVMAWEQELLLCREWGGEVIALEELAGEVRAQ